MCCLSICLTGANLFYSLVAILIDNNPAGDYISHKSSLFFSLSLRNVLKIKFLIISEHDVRLNRHFLLVSTEFEDIIIQEIG